MYYLILSSQNPLSFSPVPSQPLNVAAESGTRSIIVSWQPPAEPNGVITQYTITITPLNSNSSQEFTASGSATSYTVPGLVPYQLVAITVTASTSAGKGPPSEVETKRPLPAGEQLKGHNRPAIS